VLYAPITEGTKEAGKGKVPASTWPRRLLRSVPTHGSATGFAFQSKERMGGLHPSSPVASVSCHARMARRSCRAPQSSHRLSVPFALSSPACCARLDHSPIYEAELRPRVFTSAHKRGCDDRAARQREVAL